MGLFAFTANKPAAACCSSTAATSGSSSTSRPLLRTAQLHVNKRKLVNICHASATASSGPEMGDRPQAPGQAAPLLSSIRRGRGLESLLADMSPRNTQTPADASSDEDIISDAATAPNAPVTPADFVEALEMVVKSTGQEVNPEQLDEIFREILSLQLLDKFTPAQLSVTVKNLAIMCSSVSQDFTVALIKQLQQHMAVFTAAQLSNVSWALMRLVPFTHPQLRQLLGMDQQWLDDYSAACQQQLQQLLAGATVHQAKATAPPPELQQQQPQQLHSQPSQQQQQQQQAAGKLPSCQQLANLLLLPAAVQQQPPTRFMQLLERALLQRQHSLCGFAVAQLLTCYGRLDLRPSPELLEVLLEHMAEELMLYDYDELTQVAFGAYVLQLQLPNVLLAEITQRARVLESARQACEGDMETLHGALERLAAQRAAPVV